MICGVIDVDIPRLSSRGIQFDEYGFLFTYSLQSSSTLYLFSSSFDANGLETVITEKGEFIK